MKSKLCLSFWQRQLLGVCHPYAVQKMNVASQGQGSNYNFLNQGKSAFGDGRHDMTQSNISFLRETYEFELLRAPMSEPEVSSRPHDWNEIRCGAVGVKLGSYPLFYKNGKRTLATLVQLLDTEVVDVSPFVNRSSLNFFFKKLNQNEKYYTVTVGCRNISPEWLTATQMEIFSKNGICCKEKLTGFVCTENAVMPPGTKITASHFVAGQVVNVWGRSLDRGFQGPMKRWNFRGMPATHGTTKSRRAHGAMSSTGLGRVLPGKRAAGQMGDKLVYKPLSRILRINTKYNVLYIQGLLPGLDGNFLSIRDTRHSKYVAKKTGISSLPFPTCLDTEDNLFDDYYAEDIYNFDDDAIVYQTEQT